MEEHEFVSERDFVVKSGGEIRGKAKVAAGLIESRVGHVAFSVVCQSYSVVRKQVVRS